MSTRNVHAAAAEKSRSTGRAGVEGSSAEGEGGQTVVLTGRNRDQLNRAQSTGAAPQLTPTTLQSRPPEQQKLVEDTFLNLSSKHLLEKVHRNSMATAFFPTQKSTSASNGFSWLGIKYGPWSESVLVEQTDFFLFHRKWHI
jgi:hypothetical protein